ncbi:PepSY domain-containing protein [Acidiphilium sp. AL]|uniref:PepSY domain-containing protein n=1 Tax=Acidiphilium iwatense TaxID=768198 RepID=A0ABS9DWX9_9PROT|nr:MULTISPECIES: PepSY domain-containing protein [Acidiphilium]MCF3947243.1 PepSY domain-containing protein [Acidiphilium iwatense]MCU4159743.1 PepSY domain-containing protein [Acidiphilium sp. AL]
MTLITKRFAIAAALSLAATGSAFAYSGQALQKDAKVTPVRARQIALRAQPGTIAAMELERETGGSGLRYSFDIKTTGATHEIGVDAKTGAVLENSVEGPSAD